MPKYGRGLNRELVGAVNAEPATNAASDGYGPTCSREAWANTCGPMPETC